MHPSRAGWQDERGLTLVEMLVAILILGVMFAGVATFLMNSTRIAMTNESRVTATAVMTEQQERMQGLRWRDLVVYEDELAAVESAAHIDLDGLDTDDDPPTFDGQELVLASGPDNTDCPEDRPQCGRRRLAPQPFREIDRDGNTYEVIQLVSWSDRADDEQDTVGDVKQITTLVAHEVGNRWVVERFDSERAATGSEIDQSERADVPLYVVRPASPRVGVTGTSDWGRPVSDISLAAHVNVGVEPSAVEVTFHVIDPDWDPDDPDGAEVPELVEETLTYPDDIQATTPEPGTARYHGFEATIPAGAHRFPVGSRPFELSVEVPDGTVRSTRTVSFTPGCIDGDPDLEAVGPIADPGGGGGAAPDPPNCAASVPGEDVQVSNVTQSPSEACVDADDHLDGPVTIGANVRGLTTDDHRVVVKYVANGRAWSRSLTSQLGDGGTVAPGSTPFERSFTGPDGEFRPTPGSSEVTAMIVVAMRDSDGQAAMTSGPSSGLTVSRC